MKLRLTQKSTLRPYLLAVVILAILTSCIACSDRAVVETEPKMLYASGKVIITIASAYYDDLDSVLKSFGGVSDSTGVTSLDNYLENYGMSEVRSMRLANYDTALVIRLGINRMLKIKIDNAVDVVTLTSNLENRIEVETAEPIGVHEIDEI